VTIVTNAKDTTQRTVKSRIPESLHAVRPNTNLLPHIIPRDGGGGGSSSSMIHNDRSKRRERTRRSDDLIERADSSAHPVFAGRQRDRVLTKVVDIDVEGNGRMDGTVDVAGREIDQGQGQEGHGQQGPAGAAERGSGNEQHD